MLRSTRALLLLATARSGLGFAPPATGRAAHQRAIRAATRICRYSSSSSSSASDTATGSSATAVVTPYTAPQFDVLDERPAYGGWRTIVHRDIRMPSGHTATFDIMKQDNPSVLVFVWFTETKTTTMIKELCPGSMEFSCGCIAGICETDKHENPLQGKRKQEVKYL
jgi:hypothetical protein